MGRVVDARGAPVSRCVVEALIPGNPRRSGTEVHTKEDGKFSLAGLRAATYKLVFEAAGFEEVVKEGVVLVEERRIELGDVPLARPGARQGSP